MNEFGPDYIIIGFIVAIYAIAKHNIPSVLGTLFTTIISLIAWPLILIFWLIGYALSRRPR